MAHKSKAQTQQGHRSGLSRRLKQPRKGQVTLGGSELTVTERFKQMLVAGMQPKK